MFEVITEAQKHEIENLAEDHHDALIAFGADLYRKGIYKGAIIGIAGAVIGIGVETAISAIVKKVKNKKEETK